MVTALVSMEDQMLWGLIRDSFRDMEYRTRVTPCPMSSFMTKRSSRRDISIPMPGSRNIQRD